MKMKKAQTGKMVPGEMTGKMYKKSAIDKIGDKQAKELDKSGVFGKAAMAKKKAPKAKSGKAMIKRADGSTSQRGLWDNIRAANPGSKLKTAVTTKPSKLKAGSKAAGRRKSFCSRMSGMKKKLTSAKTANDPNSRINKSLRKWNC